MVDEFLLFKGAISKAGRHYFIHVPSALKPVAERMHGITGIVHFIPYSMVERWKTICKVEFTKRAKQVRAKTIRCGDLELEIKNPKVARELVNYLPPRPDNLFDWKEVVLALLKIASERTIGEEFGEHELTGTDRGYAVSLAVEIMANII